MTSLARRLLIAIAVLAGAGAVVSSVSLYHHYGTESSYCDFSATLNCDIVNRSIYSAIFGIPVALIGILGYLGLAAMATVFRGRDEAPAVLVAASLVGLAFALYLTYIEGFVLAVWCVLCLSSLGLITIIAALSVGLMGVRRRV